MNNWVKRITSKVKAIGSDSLYLKWIKKNKGLILACVLISTFLCFLSYPGIMYSDSHSRIEFASRLKPSLHAFFSGNAELKEIQSWLTVAPSFFILLSQEIVGSVVLYTFCQCFFLFFMTYIFGDKLTECGHRAWNRVCITFAPVIWAYGVYYEASVGCITAVMAIVLLIWKWDVLESYFDKTVTILLLIIASYICFGFRANAFTIMPVLILIIILRERKTVRSLILILSICVGFLITSLIPRALNIDTMSSYAGAFIWETVSVIQSFDDEKQAEYGAYLDDIFGEGVTAAAIANNTYTEEDSSINLIWWGHPFKPADVSKPENTKQTLKKYMELIKNEPKAYLKVKWEFISHTLGISQPLRMVEYDYNKNDRMQQYGFNDSKQRKLYVDYFLSYMQYMKIFRVPWIMFLAALIMLIIWRFAFCGGKSKLNLYEAAYGIAVFYYGGYVLNTQSFEFRYYFPSWLLLFLIIVSITADICFRKAAIKKWFVVFLCVTCVICFTGSYRKYIEEIDKNINALREQGCFIYENEDNQVYYLNDELYFISKKGADNSYPFFLLYHTSEGDMINSEFSFENKAKFLTLGADNLAVVEMPKQAVVSMEFGQHYGGKRFWAHSVEVTEFLTVPRKIAVSEYSDTDWTDGYGNTGNVFLTDDTGVENYLLKGKGLLLPDGSTARISEVKEEAGRLKIYTDIPVNHVTAREYEVIN